MRFFQQRPERLERIPRQGDKSVGLVERLPVDLGSLAGRAEDKIGIESDHRIAPPLSAAFDRFQKEHVAGAAAGELEIC